MAKKSLYFQSLKLDQSPGLKDGLPAFKVFSAGINIVAGANAAGKSSTARAMQQLLGSDEGERIKARAQFSIGKEAWVTEVDASFRKTQKDGMDTPLKNLPPPEEQKRYLLSIQDLLLKKDRNLAEYILKEAVGGYDAAAAGKRLSYSKAAASKNRAEFKEYQEAAKTVSGITNKQKELQDDEHKLDLLKAEKNAAELAERLTGFYELLEKLGAEKEKAEQLRRELALYPAEMERVREGDYEQLRNARDRIKKTEANLAEARQRIEETENKLRNLTLPEAGVDLGDLKKLSYLTESLQALAKSQADKEEEIAGLQEELQSREKTTGVSQETLLTLNLVELNQAESDWSRAFDYAGEISRLQQAAERYQSERKEADASQAQLQKAVFSLQEWIAEYGGASRPLSKGILAGLVLSAAGTAVLVQLLGTAGYAGLVFVLGFGLWLLKNSGKPVSLQEDVHRRGFEQTGLQPPAAWELEKVKERMVALDEELMLVRRLVQTEEELLQKKKDFEQYRKSLESVEARLKAINKMDSGGLNKYSSLFWYLNELLGYRDTLKKVQHAMAVTEESEKKSAVLLNQINEILSEYQISPATGVEEARAQKDVLDDKKERFRRLTEQLNLDINTLSNLDNDKQREQGVAAAILKRLNLPEEEDSYRVKELTGRLEAYSALKDRLRITSARVEELTGEFQNHYLYQEYGEEAEALPADEIGFKLRDCRMEAAKLVEIRDEITRIKTLVDKARQSHELENALQKQDDALSALEELYKTNASSVVGEVLVEELNRRMSRENMPDVFHRAKELFSRFTRYRYELLLAQDEKEAVFRAIDLQDGIGRGLDELSSGTRIQLLLAVRLAFIEFAEQDVMLPLFADELLANSDDRRAEAIMDALIEISREGRQVFYFTAQGDEVVKWYQKLEQEDVRGFGTHILDPRGGFEVPRKTEPDLFSNIVLTQEIPAPESDDYEAYGRLLKVPPVSSVFEDAEQLHLWYFLDDVNALHDLLSIGLETRGMLKSFLENGGPVNLSRPQLREIEKRAGLITRFLELNRVGKNKPIDRQVIEDSGAVSDTFMEEVMAVLQKNGFNPAVLITALEAGEVKRFLKSKTEELQEFLLAEGYLTRETPLTDEEISLKINSYLAQNDIPVEDAGYLLKRLG